MSIAAFALAHAAVSQPAPTSNPVKLPAMRTAVAVPDQTHAPEPR